jgi:pyruvate kinase
MKRARRTKIIATLGPASDSPEMIARLFEAGVDVFRLNMSHLPRERLREKVDVIRAAERGSSGRSPSRRPAGAEAAGRRLRRRRRDAGPGRALRARFRRARRRRQARLPAPPEILGALEVGQSILVDDGKLRLKVKEVKTGRAVTEVQVGGRISNRKGVNLPDTSDPLAAMTEKDRSDLEAALDAGVDWIGVSFVQRPEDVADVKKVARGRALVMTKLEKPQALTRLDEIMEISDAVMVARGDLGVECPSRRCRGCRSASRATRAAPASRW